MVRSWLRQLIFPDVQEPLPLRHLRRGAQLILAIDLALIALNLGYAWMHRADVPASPALVSGGLAVNVGSHAISAAVCAFLLVLRRGEAAFRAGALVSLTCLMIAAGVGTWVAGVALALPTVMMVIAVSRVYYDGRIGFVAFAQAVLVQLGLLALLQGGVLPPFPPAIVPALSLALYDATRSIAFLAMAWLGASLVANRYRRSEHTLRVALDARERLRRRELAPRFAAVTQSVDPEAPTDGPSIGRLSGSVLAGLYDVHELLGRGGMGEVYQGLRLTDGREVAIKVLHPSLHDHEHMVERFRREAALAARLPARFVPALYDQGTSPEGLHFMILERLHGEDLGRLLRREGRRPPAEVAGIVDQLAGALDAAHALGIVHRDLKPSNVFVLAGAPADARVRLLDFGIARLFEAGSAEATGHAVLGSPGFLAPEQARGDRAHIGPATDVFALGALTYRALTGENAFRGRDMASAVHEALYFEPAPASDLVPELHHDVDLVLATALAKAPELRQAGAGAFARDLRSALDGRLPPAARTHAERVLALHDSTSGGATASVVREQLP